MDQARRAAELAHFGKVSKALGALTSGGVLPCRMLTTLSHRFSGHTFEATKITGLRYRRLL